jgi:hypothetical protein
MDVGPNRVLSLTPHSSKEPQLLIKCYSGPRNWTEGAVGGSCERGNELSGYITGG